MFYYIKEQMFYPSSEKSNKIIMLFVGDSFATARSARLKAQKELAVVKILELIYQWIKFWVPQPDNIHLHNNLKLDYLKTAFFKQQRLSL